VPVPGIATLAATAVAVCVTLSSSTLIVDVPLSSAAKSGLPSPLKSPTVRQ
jgi:hypothetical protein